MREKAKTAKSIRIFLKSIIEKHEFYSDSVIPTEKVWYLAARKLRDKILESNSEKFKAIWQLHIVKLLNEIKEEYNEEAW